MSNAYQPKYGRPLHELLRELRQETGWSQGQFAAQCEVSESTISRVESGELIPPQAVLDLYGKAARRSP